MTRQQTKFMAGELVGEWKLLSYRAGAWEREGLRYRQTRKPEWKCECSCGAIRWVRAANLSAGGTQSCGHDKPALVVRHGQRDVQPVNSVFALGGAA